MRKLEYKNQRESQDKMTIKEVLTSDNRTISTCEYIESFLITRGYEATQNNIAAIARSLERAPKRDRHSASELDHWLDYYFQN